MENIVRLLRTLRDALATTTDVFTTSEPGSAGPPVPFLMYPQGEDDSGRFYSLDPGAFRYAISARELG